MTLSPDLLKCLQALSVAERKEPDLTGPCRKAFKAAMCEAYAHLFGRSIQQLNGKQWNQLIDRLDQVHPGWRGYRVGQTHQRRQPNG
jgi:hypothetical protein